MARSRRLSESEVTRVRTGFSVGPTGMTFTFVEFLEFAALLEEL